MMSSRARNPCESMGHDFVRTSAVSGRRGHDLGQRTDEPEEAAHVGRCSTSVRSWPTSGRQLERPVPTRRSVAVLGQPMSAVRVMLLEAQEALVNGDGGRQRLFQRPSGAGRSPTVP